MSHLDAAEGLGETEMGQQQFCTEKRVREIVRMEMTRHVAQYERNIGGPRHTANQAWLNKISGGITVLKWIGGIAVGLGTIAAAYAAIHHH